MKEYKPLKIPDGMSENLLFNLATGNQLDVFGETTGLKRRKFLFIKEPDFLFKIRLRNVNIVQKTNAKPRKQ